MHSVARVLDVARSDQVRVDPHQPAFAAALAAAENGVGGHWGVPSTT